MLRAMSKTNRKAPRLVVLAAVLAAPLLASGRAHAAVTIVTQRGQEAAETLYLDGDKMRADNSKGTGERTVIIDAAAKKMVSVNDTEKTYTEITQADMERFGAMMAAQRSMMEERMKSMPPEQRKKMEGMMGGGKTPEFKFEKMGAKKNINGFSCEMYRVLEDGTPKEEVCITPWSSSFITKADFAGLVKFSADMQKSLGKMMGGQRNPFEQFEKAPGFPVMRHHIDATPLVPGGPPREDEVVKSVKRGSLPASTFSVPAGYTKKDLPMGPMGGGRPHHGMPPQ
jgi:hypothetical protein